MLPGTSAFQQLPPQLRVCCLSEGLASGQQDTTGSKHRELFHAPQFETQEHSKSMTWASLGTFSHRVLWWVEHFVFWLIRSLHGAVGMTKTHIIATLGSNYLKTDLFPESSSLFRWRPPLSPFKNHPSSQESRTFHSASCCVCQEMTYLV